MRIRLKPVHRVLLGIAWWKANGGRLCRTGVKMQQLVEFCLMYHANFQFETFVVDANCEVPFKRRPQSDQEVVVIQDPTGRAGNLGGRVNADSLRTMFTALRNVGRSCQRNPDAFWRDRVSQWRQQLVAQPPAPRIGELEPERWPPWEEMAAQAKGEEAAAQSAPPPKG